MLNVFFLNKLFRLSKCYVNTGIKNDRLPKIERDKFTSFFSRKWLPEMEVPDLHDPCVHLLIANSLFLYYF